MPLTHFSRKSTGPCFDDLVLICCFSGVHKRYFLAIFLIGKPQESALRRSIFRNIYSLLPMLAYVRGGFALLLVQRKGRSIEVESGGAESTFPDTANLAALMANGLHLYLQQQFRK